MMKISQLLEPAKPEALQIINKLGLKKVNKKVIYYELTCGIDYRFLDLKLAFALKNNRFKNIRIAWDWDKSKMREQPEYEIEIKGKRFIVLEEEVDKL